MSAQYDVGALVETHALDNPDDRFEAVVIADNGKGVTLLGPDRHRPARKLASFYRDYSEVTAVPL